MNDQFYIYALLDHRKPGPFWYEELGVIFDYLPIYIGKGKGDRCKQHLTLTQLNYKTCDNIIKCRILNKILKNIDKKNYIENYIIILERNLSNDQSLKLENEYIQVIGRLNNKYKYGPLSNMDDGGEGRTNWIVTNKTKEKMSKNHADFSGKNNPMYGTTQEKSPWYNKTHTKETKEKLKNLNTGNKNPMFGRLGKLHPNFGKAMSMEQKEKLRKKAIIRYLIKEHHPSFGKIGIKNSVSKIYIFYNPNGVLSYPIFNLLEFCKSKSLNYSCMIHISNGRRKHHQGWRLYKVYTKNEWNNIVNNIYYI